MLCDHAYGFLVATIVSPLSFIALPLPLAVWLRESVANACLPHGTCPVYQSKSNNIKLEKVARSNIKDATEESRTLTMD